MIIKTTSFITFTCNVEELVISQGSEKIKFTGGIGFKQCKVYAASSRQLMVESGFD
jgi:hypothetical protein